MTKKANSINHQGKNIIDEKICIRLEMGNKTSNHMDTSLSNYEQRVSYVCRSRVPSGGL